jgi:hypothetical protein
MFCVPGIVFGGIEGVGPHFQVLRARTCFRRYRGHRVPFSCFARPDLFSAVPKASCPFYMFCAPVLFFGGTEGVVSRFQVLCARTCFQQYRGRSVPFSSFARPDLFSAITRASGPVLMFCAPILIFGGTEGADTHFLILRAQTHFGGSEGVGIRFHVFRARPCFRRYRGRRHQFSCIARPDSVSTVPMASCPVFMFCAPGLVFGGTEGGMSRFHVLRARTRFRLYRGRQLPFLSFARSD